MDSIKNILFIDIETVPASKDFQSLSSELKEFWTEKAKYWQNVSDGSSNIDTVFEQKAGIYAEFGKIICISVGIFNRSGNYWQFRVKSFYGDDEKILLDEFITMLNRHFDDPDNLLCAHNGKEFDFPYLCRRMLINSLEIPSLLNIVGKKPWEVNHLDTMELWKFGDYKNFTSLELLAATFNIPTPKDDIDGSQVWTVYWNEKDLERIKTYCQKDVVTVAQLILRFRGEALLEEHDVIIN